MWALLRNITPPPTNSNSGMWELLSHSPPPSPPAKSNFGMWDLLRDTTPSPTTSDIGMQELLPLSPTLLPSPEPRHVSGVWGTHTLPLVPSHDSDLRIQHFHLPESQDNIGMQTAPPPELHGSSSSSQQPHEFCIANFDMHLILVLAGWSWGDQAPVPMPQTVGGAEHRGESVGQAVHMLE